MEARTKGRKVKAIESFVNFAESQPVVGEKRKFTHGWGSDSDNEEETQKVDSESEDEMKEVHTSAPMSVAPVPMSAPVSVPTTTSVPVSVPTSAPVSVHVSAPASVSTSSAAKSTAEPAAVPTGKTAGKKGWTAIRTSMVDEDNPFIVEGSAGPAKKVTVRKAGTK